jgi:hypothetical protein
MVSTSTPADADMGHMHERIGAPLTWTVHAPHCPSPHPNLAPFRSSLSRNTQRRGISGDASTVVDLPFTLKVTLIVPASAPMTPAIPRQLPFEAYRNLPASSNSVVISSVQHLDVGEL